MQDTKSCKLWEIINLKLQTNKIRTLVKIHRDVKLLSWGRHKISEESRYVIHRHAQRTRKRVSLARWQKDLAESEWTGMCKDRRFRDWSTDDWGFKMEHGLQEHTDDKDSKYQMLEGRRAEGKPDRQEGMKEKMEQRHQRSKKRRGRW